jgi:hypothetical protein
MVEGLRPPRPMLKCQACMFTISEEEARAIAIANGGIVACENCGVILAELNDGEIEQKSLKGLKKSIATKQDKYSLKAYENNPIGRIHLDSDFSKDFKQDFLLFFARIVHYVMKELEHQRGNPIAQWTLDDALLTKIVDNANPVLYTLTRNLFLQKLK